jgi:membrane protein DedA with SNARE-associated domain
LGYVIGYFSSKWVKKKLGHDHNYIAAEKFIEEHGGKSVFLARFISGIKELVPFIAGVMSMKMKKFMFWNFLGAIGWSVLWLLAGFFLGENIKDIDAITRATGIAVFIFFVITVVLIYIRNRRKKKSK